VGANGIDRKAGVSVAGNALFWLARHSLNVTAVRLGQEAAKIRVPLVVLHEDDQRALRVQRQFAPDHQTDALLFCLLVGSNDSVETVAIGNGDGVVVEVTGSLDEVCGRRSSSQEREVRPRIQLYVSGPGRSWARRNLPGHVFQRKAA
jgi:hypothetical protein